MHWEISEDITWDTRWGAYLRDASAQQIHMISIMNALIIVLFLMVPVVSIVKRTVFEEPAHTSRTHTQAHTHEEIALHPIHARTHPHDESTHHHSDEEAAHYTHTARTHYARAHDEDETRWRFLGVEALRAPANPMALSVLLGSGVQVIWMIIVVISMWDGGGRGWS